MLGTPRLLAFSLRAMALILLISLLWIVVAQHYNDALEVVARPLLPVQTSLKVFGTELQINHPDLPGPIAIRGLVLHYGLILMSVLVLAAGGISAGARMRWLAGLGAAGFGLHVVAVTLVARGLVWASGSSSPEGASLLVLRLFAVFWSLLPAAIGAAWVLLYWWPRARHT